MPQSPPGPPPSGGMFRPQSPPGPPPSGGMFVPQSPPGPPPSGGIFRPPGFNHDDRGDDSDSDDDLEVMKIISVRKKAIEFCATDGMEWDSLDDSQRKYYMDKAKLLDDEMYDEHEFAVDGDVARASKRPRVT